MNEPNKIAPVPTSSNRAWLAAILAALILLAAVWGYFSLWARPLTPDVFRTRGVAWRVVAEEPIPMDAVEGIIGVFSAQVNSIFRIPVHGQTFERIPNDNTEGYAVWVSQRGEVAPQGPIQVPITFLTGIGRVPETGNASYGRGQRSDHYATSSGGGIRTGIEIYIGGGLANGTSCCSETQVQRLLHEFGHNLGLADLYWDNLGGIRGCENLNVIMSSHQEIPSPDLPPTGRLIFRKWEPNVPNGTRPLSARDTYFDLASNNLTLAYWAVDVEAGVARVVKLANESYDLDLYRLGWTAEQAEYLGIEVDPDASLSSCREERLPER